MFFAEKPSVPFAKIAISAKKANFGNFGTIGKRHKGLGGGL